jgi:hypothetical protein
MSFLHAQLAAGVDARDPPCTERALAGTSTSAAAALHFTTTVRPDNPQASRGGAGVQKQPLLVVGGGTSGGDHFATVSSLEYGMAATKAAVEHRSDTEAAHGRSTAFTRELASGAGIAGLRR